MAKKPFINPLTRPSEKVTPPKQVERAKPPKDNNLSFEATHQRFTAWLDKDLKRQFDALAAEKGIAKSALLDAAVLALLRKHKRGPTT